MAEKTKTLFVEKQCYCPYHEDNGTHMCVCCGGTLEEKHWKENKTEKKKK